MITGSKCGLMKELTKDFGPSEYSVKKTKLKRLKKYKWK